MSPVQQQPPTTPSARRHNGNLWRKKLLAWRSGLVGVLGVVSGAREQAFGGAEGNARELESGKDVKEKEKPIVHGDLAPTGGVAA